jgi:CDP-6-deoxy-D-xylo-4-hexulose-3-dehydrase
MIKIRIGDIQIGEEERRAVNEVVESGRFSEGKKTQEFESLWSKYIGTKYCIAVNSGTSALLAGLYALLYDDRYEKVKKGSKVITSPVTYIATSNAIVLSGLQPVYVDIDSYTFTLDVNQIEELVKKDPDSYSIILPVHLMGYPNNMDALNYLADKYDLVVFEDAAQAHGSIYKGKKVGSLSLLASYSFYIAHNIQVGEMGAVVTNDEKIRKLVKKIKAKCPYRNESFDPRFTHEYIGFNFKTTEFQSAIAIPQVMKADFIIKKRQENVRFLNENFNSLSDFFQLPIYSENVSYLAYPIIIRSDRIKRKEIMQKLEQKGIETRPLFGCIPTQQPAYNYLKTMYEGKLPIADYIGANGFYIGCHQYLNRDDLSYVVESLERIIMDLR